MNPLQDRIAQFRKMANDDPDNELGHYRLGQLLLEAGQFDEAIQSFRRTLDLSPQFSRAFQLLAQALLAANQKEEAIRTLRQGCKVALERGDNVPLDEMTQMLVGLGEQPPQPRPAAVPEPEPSGFRCQRPGCMTGGQAQQLSQIPLGLEPAVGQRIRDTICADCWNSWLKNMSIKVINELRLDLSDERGAEEYDRYMREYLGLD